MDLPHQFKTLDQLRGYIKCLRSIKVGDQVEIYVDGIGYLSTTPRDWFVVADVIFVSHNPRVDIYAGWPSVWSNYEFGTPEIPLIILHGDHEHFSDPSEWMTTITRAIYKSKPDAHKTAILFPDGVLLKRIIKKQ